MEEANNFISIKEKTSILIALATFLCILSPICLLILCSLSEIPEYNLSDNVAGGIGMIVLLILVAIATIMFVSCGRKTAGYEFLEKEEFKTENGVIEMTSKRKAKYNRVYTRNNIIGVSLCIISSIPLFIGAIFNDENALLLMIMLSITLVIAGIGVVFFIRSGIIWVSYEKLLQEGDYSKEKKKKQSLATTILVTYWLIATAIYLGYSLFTNNWEYSWVVWVVAGVVFPAVAMITNLFNKKK